MGDASSEKTAALRGGVMKKKVCSTEAVLRLRRRGGGVGDPSLKLSSLDLPDRGTRGKRDSRERTTTRLLVFKRE